MSSSKSSRSHSSSCSAGSRASNSTAVYGHVPYSEFSGQVAELCKTIFPSVPPQSIRLEHLQGGSSNRIVGVSLPQLDNSVTSTRSLYVASSLSSAASSDRTPSLGASSHTSGAPSTKAPSSPPSSPILKALDTGEVPPLPRSSTYITADAHELEPLPLSITKLAATADVLVSLPTGAAFFPIADLEALPPLPQSPAIAADNTEALPPLPRSTSIAADDTQELPSPPQSPRSVSFSTVIPPNQSEEEDTGYPTLEEGAQWEEFVLRIPRWDEGKVEQEIGLLGYLRTRTTLPVPKIRYYELTTDNAIASPYVVQDRIAGENMHTMYEKLTTTEKKCFIAEFVHLLRQLQDISSPVSGDLGFSTSLPSARPLEASIHSDKCIEEGRSLMARCFADSANDVRLTGSSDASLEVRYHTNIWAEEGEDDYNDKMVNPDGHSTLSMLLLQFERHKALSLLCDPLSTFDVDYMDRLAQAARETNSLNCLGDDKMTLFHGDLEPRNIMGHIDEQGSVKITAVLDWDNASFAPRFMSCQPPDWIWDFSDGDWEELETYPTPIDNELRELKETFESAVGQDFLDLSYAPQYRLARQLFRIAIAGLHETHYIEEADKFLTGWNALRNDLLKQLGGDG